VSPQDLNGGAYSAPQTQSRFSGAALWQWRGGRKRLGKGRKGGNDGKGRRRERSPVLFLQLTTDYHYYDYHYFYFGFVFNRNIWRIFQLTPDLAYFFNEESLGMSTVLWHCWSSLFSNLSFQAIPENKSQCKREASNSFWPAESMRMYVSVVCAASASCCASLYNKRRYGIGCRAPFANLRPRTVSRRLWRHSVHRQYLTVPYILSLRCCMHYRSCTGPLLLLVTVLWRPRNYRDIILSLSTYGVRRLRVLRQSCDLLTSPLDQTISPSSHSFRVQFSETALESCSHTVIHCFLRTRSPVFMLVFFHLYLPLGRLLISCDKK